MDMEADIFSNGPVNQGKLSSRLIQMKTSTWIFAGFNINTCDKHSLIMLLWVSHIICFHWINLSINSGKIKTKKCIVCSFEKTPVGTEIRTNHCDDTCWITIPHI